MQSAMFVARVVSFVAMLVALVCIIILLLNKNMRKNWKVYFTIGLCIAIFAVDSLIELLVFGKSHGWIDGLWMTLYIFASWLSFRDAKKLRAAQRQAEAKSKE